jgi:hypothetical protein
VRAGVGGVLAGGTCFSNCCPTGEVCDAGHVGRSGRGDWMSLHHCMSNEGCERLIPGDGRGDIQDRQGCARVKLSYAGMP